MQHWRKEIAKRRSPFKQTGGEWDRKKFERAKKAGMSDERANAYARGATFSQLESGDWDRDLGRPPSSTERNWAGNQPEKEEFDPFAEEEIDISNEIDISGLEEKKEKGWIDKAKEFVGLGEEEFDPFSEEHAHPFEGRTRDEIDSHDWVQKWYSHPETKKRLDKDYWGWQQDALKERVSEAERGGTIENARAHAQYDPNTHEYQFHDTPGGRSAIAHELVHASGFDKKLGKRTKDILGPSDVFGPNADYYNNPREQYTNMVDIRRKLNLDPGDRNITPQRLRDMIDDYEYDTGKRLEPDFFEHFSLENVSKALNTVAEAKPKAKWRQEIDDRRRWS